MFNKKLLKKENEQSMNIYCPLLDYLYAKTQKNDKVSYFGQTIWQHSYFSGVVAKYLLNLLPKNIKEILFPIGSDFVVSLHDIGKISPVFALKLVLAVYGKIPDEFLYLSEFSTFVSEGKYSHPIIGGLYFSNFCKNISYIVGQHHGVYSTTNSSNICGEVFGGDSWNSKRDELVEKLSREFLPTTNVNNVYENFKSITPTQLSAISGLTTLSDWLASSELFSQIEEKNAEDVINSKLKELGFQHLSIKKDLSFLDIFGFPANVIQDKFTNIVEQGGLYILEAPMGIGKTEAALYAAYKVLSKGGATGVYFALPTQTTSEKIYERFTSFIDKFVDKENLFCKLLHSKAKYYEINNGSSNSEDFSWFSSSKRGLLARFAVGTIDQALMSVLNVRHGFVRDFGLIGKVVILDEIHTYDCFTQVFIKNMIKRLKELHCTVIILSATLHKEQRHELLNCWSNSSKFYSRYPYSYPLISYVNKDSVIKQEVIDNDNVLVNKTVKTSFKSEKDCIEEALKRAEQGQQVLWIDNTVDKAQEIFGYLSTRAKEFDTSVEIGILHSRFTTFDRSKIEEKWLNLLGKNTCKEERYSKGRILVGTQILEQSIDIDSDFMISRMAPSDMLLQRMGRLWRHERCRNELAKTEFWIIDVPLEKAVSSPCDDTCFGKSAFVYEPYILCRTLEVFKKIKNSICIPKDIPQIINNTYKYQSDEEEQLQKLKYEMEHGSLYKKGTLQLKQKANSLLSIDGVIRDNQEDVCSRYSEYDTSGILILRSINEQKSSCQIKLFDGTDLSIDSNKMVSYDQLKLGMLSIEGNIVPCSELKLPTRVKLGRAKKLGLSKYKYLGNEYTEEINIGIMVLSECDKLSNFESTESDKNEFFYNSRTGLVIRSRNG